MTSIEVDPDGLSSMSSSCSEQAAAVRNAAASTPNVAGGLHATTAAVLAVHADIVALGQRLARRLEQTAATARAASLGYETSDAANASRIGSVAPTSDITQV